MTSKSLKAKIAKIHGNNKVDVYKGHTMGGDYGWIVKPFGKNEDYLGATLKDAHEEIDNRIAYKNDLRAQMAE